MLTPARFLFLLLCGSIVFFSCSQKNDRPFYDEIAAFKQADKDSFPPGNAILFVGSSSFRLWKNVQNDFPGYTIINRGFGGSGLGDLIRYSSDIILPYHPKQVVIYCGENDIATGKVSAEELLEKFTKLFNIIRNGLPSANILFLSMKPSPSREKWQPGLEEANILIRKFLSAYPETEYVDIYHPMLDKEGKPRKELFLGDELHMNEKGYAIWKEALTPELLP